MEGVEKTVFVHRARKCCGGLLAVSRTNDQEHFEAGDEVEEVPIHRFKQMHWCSHLLSEQPLPQWALADGLACGRIDYGDLGDHITPSLMEAMRVMHLRHDYPLPLWADANKLAAALDAIMGVSIGCREDDGATDIRMYIPSDSTIVIALPNQPPPSCLRTNPNTGEQIISVPYIAEVLGVAVAHQCTGWAPAPGQIFEDACKGMPGIENAGPALMAASGKDEDAVLQHICAFYSTLAGAVTLWFMGLPASVIAYTIADFESRHHERKGVTSLVAKAFPDAFFFIEVFDNLVKTTNPRVVWEGAGDAKTRAIAVFQVAKAFTFRLSACALQAQGVMEKAGREGKFRNS